MSHKDHLAPLVLFSCYVSVFHTLVDCMLAQPCDWCQTCLNDFLGKPRDMVGKKSLELFMQFWSHLRQLPPTPGPQTESPFVPHTESFLQLTGKLILICHSKWGGYLEIWRFKNPETWGQHSVEGRGFLCMISSASWQLLSSQLSTGLCFPCVLLWQSADLFSAWVSLPQGLCYPEDQGCFQRDGETVIKSQT